MKIGDKVRWRSQSQGSWTAKEGEIIDVIPAWQHPGAKYPGLGIGSFPRKRETYIVKVGSKLYWPRVSALIELL